MATLQGSSFSTGLEVQDKRKRVLFISTGSKSVDTALGGRQFGFSFKMVTHSPKVA